ncbi:hypothetical protein MC378_14910 [Polaribacter sp. MSW13]|uniref:AAA+ ATPase domain-containing protein n=1 Tax=Polaribacter marinus TaxID=2916838 RepID=A0A9X1VRD5_9FLAO|nr:hypothetical protein [Polaribacter marinus]MCI2230468.1 hypothetical protein [Polaribacter marinus]
MYTEKDKNNFFSATDSLKKYRRADLLDTKGNTLIQELYVDLLPNEQVFKSCLSDNTTFLVGRKGTGKSTIILRLENEYRKKKEYVSCYLDTKTIFESSKSDFVSFDYLSEKIPEKTLEKYLIERAFIQTILSQIIKELDKQFQSTIDKIKGILGFDKTEDVRKRLKEILNKIESNEHLKSIEIPVISEVNRRLKSSTEDFKDKAFKNQAEIGASASTIGPKIEGKLSHIDEERITNKKQDEWENEFSQIFLRVFQIKDVINEVKEVLALINIKHLIVFLDDFSEIEESSLKRFVDVVLAPLNNWSEEFIKFKIAAYPNRLHFGDIDKGKVDIIDLDFYNLYSEFDRGTMEDRAIDFTKRLIDSRINHFTKEPIEHYFDTKNESIEEYYKLIFQISMNVPRIVGYVLFYCYQSNILYDNPINKKALESAAERYYDKVISSFFDTTTYSLISYDDKITALQQGELLKVFTNSLKDIRKRIVTGDLTGESYKSTSKNPFSSHFYFPPNLEQFIKTLELNFFISKYNEMSDRDGSKVSIYSINYGLAMLNNLRWGKPEGTAYRKYFIARPFDFSKKIEEFLKESKKIICINPSCAKTYPYEQLEFLKFNKMRCVECQNPIKVTSVSENIQEELEKIDKSKLLPKVDFSLLYELQKNEEPLYAREIAEELDVSSYLIAGRGKRLDEKYGYVKRVHSGQLYAYTITEKAKEEYFNKNGAQHRI